VYRLGRLLEGRIGVGSANWEALTQGLHELGYIEGETLVWENAIAEDQYERLPDLAVGLVHASVDLIVAVGFYAVSAAKDATSTIPIVMPISGDPVALGHVASLARPGGNITGLSSQSPQMSAKRLELLRDAVPGARRVAVLWNGAHPTKVLDYRETEAAAPTLGLTLQSLPVRGVDEFESALEAASRNGADALIVLGDPLMNPNQGRILELAGRRHLPALLEPREAAVVGALLTYGPNHPDLYRRAATYIDKILKGAKPADLPIEQPTKFDLVVNLQTARTLGLTIPPSVLAQATEVIQ
jgi:putative ABC transport system substrate-binding protein